MLHRTLRARRGRLGALATGVATVLVVAGALAGSALAAPGAECPSGGTPAAGSTVNGGLEVDGFCTVNDVTVNGGIVIDPNAGLGFENSTANGGITVGDGAELDMNQALFGGPPSGAGTINGSLILNNPIDFDIFGARISGGLRVNTDNSTESGPTVCGSRIDGGVVVSHAHTDGAINIGDPEDPPAFSAQPCPGNTINGGLTFNDVNPGVVEGNRITGPVELKDSTTELNGNRISGPVSCTGDTVLVDGESPDPASNACS